MVELSDRKRSQSKTQVLRYKSLKMLICAETSPPRLYPLPTPTYPQPSGSKAEHRYEEQ